ncbi:MAG: hypothetical protein JWR83_408 [Aeromicrobium sp.]|nr:hypothetical protein [Aeromicrobium sp.]
MSPVRPSRSGDQWERPRTTGWPGRPSYVARRRSPGSGFLPSMRITASEESSGRSTRVTTATAASVESQNASPSAKDADCPRDHSRATTTLASVGARCIAASAKEPRTTTASLQPPSTSARQVSCNHGVPRASRAIAFGIPNRLPTPAASTSPIAPSATAIVRAVAGEDQRLGELRQRVADQGGQGDHHDERPQLVVLVQRE